MRIRVRYFAQLRERAGRESEEVEWQDAEPTLERLRAWLSRSRPGVGEYLQGRPLLCAVNREYAPPETVLREGDEVAFFPPVTGG